VIAVIIHVLHPYAATPDRAQPGQMVVRQPEAPTVADFDDEKVQQLFGLGIRQEQHGVRQRVDEAPLNNRFVGLGAMAHQIRVARFEKFRLPSQCRHRSVRGCMPPPH